MRLNSTLAAVLLGCTISPHFGQRPATATPVTPDEQYVLGPDSQPQAHVPVGKVLEFTLADSKTFPGFEHRWSLYIPAQYDVRKPAALMVFQDGGWYVQRDGLWRVPVVLDNLIARKELPVMAAVFVNPGASIGKKADGSPIDSNRSVEYDTLSAAYATFLLEEILPEVRRHIEIINSPEARGISGCLAASGSIPQSDLLQRQLHQHSRRPGLPHADSRDEQEAPPRLSTKWYPRYGCSRLGHLVRSQ
jgi:hypothetical protein